MFFTKPNPILNPKPDFLKKIRTLNPNPNPELDFCKPTNFVNPQTEPATIL
jgi:hypothetical protein